MFIAQAAGTGLEYIVALSFILPVIALIVIFMLGSRNTVERFLK